MSLDSFLHSPERADIEDELMILHYDMQSASMLTDLLFTGNREFIRMAAGETDWDIHEGPEPDGYNPENGSPSSR